MSVVQVCAHCATRWPVVGAPAQWCPRCQGVLLSPVDTLRPTPPSRRNFRWVARSPYRQLVGPRPPARELGPTPRYSEVPRWGLLDPPPERPDDRLTRTESAADLAPTLLACTAIVFGLAAASEAFRYGLLLFNRVRLVDPLTLALSDSMVWATQVSAPLVALAAAIASVCRLALTRRRVLAARGLADPRSPRSLAVGVLVPVVNLVMPGVFLSEIAGGDRRTLTAIRIWWAAWVANGALVAVGLLWRNRDTLQAQADGVVLAAVTAAVAAATALLTLHIVRRFDDRDLFGRQHRSARWINVPRNAQPEEAAVG
ncbi:DUF4328 domain-containing protein [Rhodococcus spongiicola]|uniref:DUF4328 domain-containing protein n=1 Tax=Rhodococcus spongiicola TaxID=2487352 RepID=A0A3S3A8T3_9NOCA|nr:DUF4328 domain-containing protein [Rhodococcus spongiicola]RVW02265.1 DUF4328 domain-containing protein [Rhodococcus spongiicola]